MMALAFNLTKGNKDVTGYSKFVGHSSAIQQEDRAVLGQYL
jgi:hypothetical protein